MAAKSMDLRAVLVVLLAAFMSFTAAAEKAKPDCFSYPINVTVTNKLGNGEHLRLHCKSADDDWGVQMLAADAKYPINQFKVCRRSYWYQYDTAINCTVGVVRDARTKTFEAYNLRQKTYVYWDKREWIVTVNRIAGYDSENKRLVMSYNW